MTIPDAIRSTVMAQGQGAMSLQLAFIGVVRGLFDALAPEPATPEALAAKLSIDAAYVRRWAEAAYAFGLLDQAGGSFALTELGQAFRPATPGTLFPVAIQAVLGAHLADRVTELMPSGERPGERVLGERASVLPWFGPMLEASFSGLFEREVLPLLETLDGPHRRGGLAVDLGCGNGWYLRRLMKCFPALRAVGLDGFEQNITAARAEAARAGLSGRLKFEQADLYGFFSTEPVVLLAMNRALHHVWDERSAMFARIASTLAPGGHVVIWEPRWPDSLIELREPRRRAMAFQNLNEHVQGNHFLVPRDIEAAMREAGLEPRTTLFAEGAEAVIVGRKPSVE